MDLKEMGWKTGLYSCGLEQGIVEVFREHVNELSGFKNCRQFID
jgi:hypothetical protein